MDEEAAHGHAVGHLVRGDLRRPVEPGGTPRLPAERDRSVACRSRVDAPCRLSELPGGELFLVWYRGSGERTADDVDIRYSRMKKGAKQWMTPREMTRRSTPR